MASADLKEFLSMGKALKTTTSKSISSLTVNSSTTNRYVPAFPLKIIQLIVEVKAEKVLPVVLAIHRQLHMTKRDETPLNAAIWKAAGSPSVKERENILKKLKNLPQIINIRKARTTTSHYRVARGSGWGETDK